MELYSQFLTKTLGIKVYTPIKYNYNERLILLFGTFKTFIS